MCGICGKFIFGGDVPSPGLLESMAHTLAHRGPDDQRIYTAAYIGLGQRRLAVIDLNPEASGPLSNEDGTVWLVFNGEIYNFRELRSQLIEKGHLFRSQTDTEVIVHAYEQWGAECLQRLHGMFAFALWDAREKKLFAARDRLGKKPFCYALTGRFFIFGSEIKAITADPEVTVEPDFFALDNYLKWQYVPSPLTAFAGIQRLSPAHCLTCDVNGAVRVERYWCPTRRPKSNAPRAEIELELSALLEKAVRMRMVADVPIGAFLSGGIDSSLVVALMSQASSHPVKTVTIGFDENTHDEREYGRLVAKQYGTDHHEYLVRPDALEVLPKLVWHYNEPFADSSALPTYYVSKVAREHVTVALTGDGGDENFGGYTGYSQAYQWARFDTIPRYLRRSLTRPVSAALDRLPHHRVTARASRALHMVGSTIAERHKLQIAIFKPQELRAAYSPRMAALVAEQSAKRPAPLEFVWTGDTDALDWMTKHDLRHYLGDCLMVKTDIASMANGLEARCPLLDQNVVEFACSIPSALKHDGTTGKQILRSIAASLVPEQILNKKKQGFGVPISAWLRSELQSMLREMLLDGRASSRGLFNMNFIRRMVDDHLTSRRDWSNRLWALMFLELWFRTFID